MRKAPKDDDVVYICIEAQQFDDENGLPFTVPPGKPIYGSRHPWRLGREHAWYPMTMGFDEIDGMPPLPPEVTIPTATHPARTG